MKGEVHENLPRLLAGFIIINTGKEKRRSEEISIEERDVPTSFCRSVDKEDR